MKRKNSLLKVGLLMIKTRKIDTNSSADVKRFNALYRSYISELSLYSERLQTQGPVARAELFALRTNPEVEIRLITNDADEPIGFYVLGFGSNKHNQSDWFIAEFYVRPDYRRLGIGSRAAQELLSSHPGRVCLYVLKENKRAAAFWQRVFADNGYVDVSENCQNEWTPKDSDFFLYINEKEA